MQENRKQSHGGQVKGMGQNEPSVRSTAEAIAKEVGGKILHHPKSSGEILHLKKRASSKKAVKSIAK